MAIKKKKSRKMEPKLVASKQTYEIAYISYRFSIPIADVKAAIKVGGRSRAKVYEYLRSPEGGGYTIITKK